MVDIPKAQIITHVTHKPRSLRIDLQTVCTQADISTHARTYSGLRKHGQTFTCTRVHTHTHKWLHMHTHRPPHAPTQIGLHMLSHSH